MPTCKEYVYANQRNALFVCTSSRLQGRVRCAHCIVQLYRADETAPFASPAPLVSTQDARHRRFPSVVLKSRGQRPLRNPRPRREAVQNRQQQDCPGTRITKRRKRRHGY
eukprot:95795-Prorocentrum_minimum.AAC.2